MTIFIIIVYYAVNGPRKPNCIKTYRGPSMGYRGYVNPEENPTDNNKININAINDISHLICWVRISTYWPSFCLRMA